MLKLKFLIVLVDNDGMNLTLVHPSAKKWINSDYGIAPGKTSIQEKIPDLIRLNDDGSVGCEEETVRVSIGSGDNDRALALMNMEDSFGSVKALFEFIRDNDIELTGEYAGTVY